MECSNTYTSYLSLCLNFLLSRLSLFVILFELSLPGNVSFPLCMPLCHLISKGLIKRGISNKVVILVNLLPISIVGAPSTGTILLLHIAFHNN